MSGLSGGERQRVLLARGLVQGARVLLFDEPTAHLDPRHTVEFLALLDELRRKDGVAAVLVVHDVGLALRACPRLLLLKEGRPVYHGPTDTLTPRHLEEAYGLPARLRPGDDGRPRFVDFHHQP